MEGLIYRNLYDEDGAIVSNDGKILYKVPDIAHYRIKEGVEEIDKHAFKNCPHLKEVDIPYTVQWYMDEPMSNDAMMYAPKGLKVNYWNWPYPENCIRSDELEAEIAEGWVDEFGAVYSKDRKRLLVCADVKNYKILEGTEKVERLAFIGCNKLQCLYFPYTLPEENFDAILGGTDTVGAISFWDRPYVPEELDPNESWVDDEVFIDEHDVVYTKDKKRLLYARIGLKKAYYEVPDGTLTICDQAFLFHVGYLVLSLPASIKVIGDDIFGKDGGKIIIRDEL
ncbi:MAG: leucine-rich repeat protein [Prevotella sp.]|jgi:hypothetical protein|nr:leucine-rich repeat protein [Prevotella sp.]